jgi:hypothetical protein
MPVKNLDALLYFTAWNYFICYCSGQRCSGPAGQGNSRQEKSVPVYCNHVMLVCILLLPSVLVIHA